MKPIVFYLTIPADLDITGKPGFAVPEGGSPRLAWASFFRDLVLARLPWGTAAEQAQFDRLSGLVEVKAGAVVELLATEHATCIDALKAARAEVAKIPGMLLTLSPFFGAMATASTTKPAESLPALPQAAE